MNQPLPSHICAPKRKCSRCGQYRSVTTGCKRLGNFVRVKSSQVSDRGFICADCAKP